MKNILLWIWQLPQNLVGVIVLLFNKVLHGCKKVKSSDGITYYYVKHINDCGVSLGNYIFLDSDLYVTNRGIHHEWGHQKQSLKYGWFYKIWQERFHPLGWIMNCQQIVNLFKFN